MPAKNFSELERLSFVVNTIENQCALVPVGALKLTPTHEILVNTCYKGLNQQESLELKSYQHFRKPQSEEKQEFIGRRSKADRF